MPFYYKVFLMILKRDRDRLVQKRSHKNHRQCDSLSLRQSLSILVRALLDGHGHASNPKETLYFFSIKNIGSLFLERLNTSLL
jgi:hypothetical protein